MVKLLFNGRFGISDGIDWSRLQLASPRHQLAVPLPSLPPRAASLLLICILQFAASRIATPEATPQHQPQRAYNITASITDPTCALSVSVRAPPPRVSGDNSVSRRQ